MRKYARIFRYLKDYKGKIGLYFIFILLSIVFSIVSVGMLMPFLELIFKGKSDTAAIFQNTSVPLVKQMGDWLREIISTGDEGKIKALAIICIIIILSIFFK